jgi:hypothetical protein
MPEVNHQSLNNLCVAIIGETPAHIIEVLSDVGSGREYSPQAILGLEEDRLAACLPIVIPGIPGRVANTILSSFWKTM